MRKNISKGSGKRQPPKTEAGEWTMGIDLGDKTSRYCVLASNGDIAEEASVAMTKKGMAGTFGGLPCCRVAMEAGGQSGWVSQYSESLGHEVIVANSRQLKLITNSSRKDDRMDARLLARLARLDPQLLRPIRHRGLPAQEHLMKVRVRAELLSARTSMVNALRGLAKSVGERLPACDADQMGVSKLEQLPATLRETLRPLMEQIEILTKRIKQCEAELEQIARDNYPETKLLRQISGVGPLIALTFVLTIDDPYRFQKSRDVGCYVGLRPKRSESGESTPQLGISKEGDKYLRALLVQGAQSILTSRAPDTDLKRWGSKLAERGGKNAKTRAVVAVARKLAILLHRLWVTAEVYEPLRNQSGSKAA